MTDSKWSTPTLKARWYDDESIEAVFPATEADLARNNAMKPQTADVAVETLSIQAFFDRMTTDEPASG